MQFDEISRFQIFRFSEFSKYAVCIHLPLQMKARLYLRLVISGGREEGGPSGGGGVVGVGGEVEGWWVLREGFGGVGSVVLPQVRVGV